MTPEPVSVMPYVETTLAGSVSGALLPPRRTQAKTEGSSRRSAVATRDTCETRPERPSLLDGLGLESRQHDDGCAGHDRAGDDGEAPDVRQRQAGQPRVASRVNTEPG